MSEDETATTGAWALRSATISELALALATAQGDVEDALRDAENPFFRTTYADLASVWRACRKALAANNLAVIQTTEHTTEGLVLRTTLAHKSGEWIGGLYPIHPMRQTKEDGWIPADDPQSTGSAITYARRYALAAIVGVAPAGDDDDAESAMRRPAQDRAAPITLRFGSGAGKTPAELEDKDLAWYAKALTRDVADPEKGKWLTQNQRTLDAILAEQAKRQKTPANVDMTTGEIFDRMVPPDDPTGAAEAAERATLIKGIKDYSERLKLPKADRDAAAETYLGQGGTLAKADIAALSGLLAWLRTRAGE